jgi:taurine dioxygenase
VITARRIGNTMGAEVTGVDLSQPLTDAIFREVLRNFLEQKVIVLRAQRVSEPAFIEWASRFGRPEPHVLDQFHHPRYPDILILSNVIENGKPLGLGDGGPIGTDIRIRDSRAPRPRARRSPTSTPPTMT